MFIVDLRCKNDHRFEGWYQNAAELKALEKRDEVTCPLCESKAHRVITASRISTSKTGKIAKPSPLKSANKKMPLEVQKALSKVVQHIRATHNDVGDKFAEEATKMHKGEVALAPIRGTTTSEDEKQMADEGVPFLKVPIPEIEKN